MQKILLVIGPTASGKTARAIKEAKERNGEVISADSRQIYKGFDVTTCKATPEEMEGISHHLMSFVAISEVYTAADFKRDADAAISDIAARGKLPIIAGGTMFYLDVLLFENTHAEVAPNETLRRALETKTNNELYAQLQTLDPRRANELSPTDRYRLVRALEIADALGSVPTLSARKPRYDVEVVYLERDRDELRARIQQRVEVRLDAMLAEIKDAKDKLDSKTARRLGFDFTLSLDHLAGKLSREELIEALTAKDWQYAKRQMLWWRSHQLPHSDEFVLTSQ